MTIPPLPADEIARLEHNVASMKLSDEERAALRDHFNKVVAAGNGTPMQFGQLVALVSAMYDVPILEAQRRLIAGHEAGFLKLPH